MKSKRIENIYKMAFGDKETIKSCLFSESKYERMDALIWTTYHKIKENDVIERVKELKKDDSVVSMYTVGNYAVASLVNLNIEKYKGNDKNQKELIKYFVPTKERVAVILKNYSE